MGIRLGGRFFFIIIVLNNLLSVFVRPPMCVLYRYGSDGNPAQEVFYFPLLRRLDEMYKDEAWRHALTYPDRSLDEQTTHVPIYSTV